MGAARSDLRDEVGLELHQLGVVEGGVDRRDQKVTLAEDGDEHVEAVVPSGLVGTSRAEAQLPFGLFDPTLKISDGVHLAEIHADGDERPGDLG